jgi:hypothetical protein
MRYRLMLGLMAGALPLAVWAQPPEPTGPQPDLPKEQLLIVGHGGAEHPFAVEVATDPEQQRVGEMFRTSVPADGGMLFDWGIPKPSPMWMRNTLVPLDMVFIGTDGVIRSIEEQTTPRSLRRIESPGPVRATLELAGGTTAKLDIRVGDTVRQRIFGNAP